MIINRVWSLPNRWTFQIKPIRILIGKYVGNGEGWIDPFAGMASPAKITNDLNPNMRASSHKDAVQFCEELNGEFNGILLDPPYSPRQMKECYDSIGVSPTMKDTQNAVLYKRVKDAITSKIKHGGIAISFGWNSTGFGKRRGFEIIEILLVNHGAGRNDTIVVVEIKRQTSLDQHAKRLGVENGN